MRMVELYALGQTVEIGSLTFTAEDIIRFATDFDPQPFHLDEELAKHALFGGLCASGWHTSAGWMKCFVPFWMGECKRLAAEGINFTHKSSFGKSADCRVAAHLGNRIKITGKHQCFHAASG